MPLKANKDTYAYEQVGPDAFVRRQIKAGQQVPDGFFADDQGNPFTEGDQIGGSTAVGLGAAPTLYRHQTDADGKLLDEHREDVSEKEQAARLGHVVNAEAEVPNAPQKQKQAQQGSGSGSGPRTARATPADTDKK
jgi:hypothetical protein